jgi:hypothetical protein
LDGPDLKERGSPWLGLGFRSPARNPGEGGSGSMDGEALVASGQRRRQDEVQKVTAGSETCSSTSIASCRGRGRRLELQARRVCVGLTVLLQNKARKGVRRCAGGWGREYEGEEGVAFTDGAGIGRGSS